MNSCDELPPIRPVSASTARKVRPQRVKMRVVGIVHLLIAEPGAGFVLVKAVGVLHDELTSPHQSEAGPDFVAKLCLDLIEVQRHLSIGADFASEEVGDHFLVGRSQTEVALVAIFKAEEFFAIEVSIVPFLATTLRGRQWA